MSKDEMNDLQEPREEDPKLEAAIADVRDRYDAYKMAGLECPLSAALFAVWVEVNRDEMSRVRIN